MAGGRKRLTLRPESRGQGSARDVLTALYQQDTELTAGVAGAMGEKTIVMAARAPLADGHGRARLTSVSSNHFTEVETFRFIDLIIGDRAVYVGAYLVTATAYRGTQVHYHFLHVEAEARERIESAPDDAGRCSLPAAVQDGA